MTAADGGTWARESWMHDAACASPAGLGVDFFATDPATVRAARAICATCPVRTSCLRAAVARGETAGVWGGGQSAEQRRPTRRITARKATRAASDRKAPPASTPPRPVNVSVTPSAEQRRPTRRTTARKAVAPAVSDRPAPPASAPPRTVKVSVAPSVEQRRPSRRTTARKAAAPTVSDRPALPVSTPRRPVKVSVAPAGGRLGPVRVDADLVERLRWLARYLGAYVAEAGDPSLAELVADALVGHAQHLIQRWDITPPPWWTPDRAA